MNLERNQGPKDGQPKKVSSARLLLRQANDRVFQEINKVVYPMDAREINRLSDKYGRQTIDSAPRRVLDIGSGTGGLANAMQHEGMNVTCADVENHHKFPNIDFSPIVDGKFPLFKDEQFDVSVLRFVLHHITKPVDALEEAMRVTKDGLIVVYEDVVREGVLRPVNEYGYKRHLTNFNVTYPESTADKTYTDADWRDVFNDAGLNVVFNRSIRRIGPPVGHELYVVKEKKAASVFETGK